jgi:hypothetical protein
MTTIVINWGAAFEAVAYMLVGCAWTIIALTATDGRKAHRQYVKRLEATVNS